MDIKRMLLQNKLLVLLFVFSTAFFLYQHTTGFSWDFSSYSLNAEYIFGDGFYFEWYRAPLAPFIIGIFGVFGSLAAEYIFIFFVSTLFLFSCLKLSRSFNINKELFYAMMLNPFLLLYGLNMGTELLSICLLMLFASYIINEKPIKSGISAGLHVLARYTNLIYLPLIFFTKNIKKIIICVVIIAILFIPWLTFNWHMTGSPFTSMANSYALNVKYRVDYIQTPFQPADVLLVTNYLLPLFLIGLYSKRKKLKLKDIMMLSVFVLTLISYSSVPVKDPRYLFTLILPCAYFSVDGIKRINWTVKPVVVINVSVIAVLIFINFFSPVPYLNLTYQSRYQIEPENCMISSNQWIFFNYMGYPSEPAPRRWEVEEKIEEGYRLIFYKDILEPDYVQNTTFIHQFPIIEENDEYILLGNKEKCAPTHVVNRTYLQRLNESIYTKYNYSIETDPCRVLFPDFCRS